MHKTVACLLFIAFLLGVIEGGNSTFGNECNHTSIYNNGCGNNERCIPTTNNAHYCICNRGYIRMRDDDECLKVSNASTAWKTDSITRQISDKPKSSGSSVAVGLLIPTFLIVLGGLGFCFAKRYRLLPCHRNHYGNVLVTRDEDDDDDPPIV